MNKYKNLKLNDYVLKNVKIIWQIKAQFYLASENDLRFIYLSTILLDGFMYSNSFSIILRIFALKLAIFCVI